MTNRTKVEIGYYVDEVKARAEKRHSHFFDADTMRFFSSRISELCYMVNQDIYFITSEADRGRIKHQGSKRAFTLRKIDQLGNITTVSKFQEYTTRHQALKALSKLLETETKIKQSGKNDQDVPLL